MAFKFFSAEFLKASTGFGAGSSKIFRTPFGFLRKTTNKRNDSSSYFYYKGYSEASYFSFLTTLQFKARSCMDILRICKILVSKTDKRFHESGSIIMEPFSHFIVIRDILSSVKHALGHLVESALLSTFKAFLLSCDSSI